jgi:hypothetical protein
MYRLLHFSFTLTSIFLSDSMYAQCEQPEHVLSAAEHEGGREGIGGDIATQRTAADIAIPIVAALKIGSARANRTWGRGKWSRYCDAADCCRHSNTNSRSARGR